MYSPQLLDHFQNPRHAGELPNPDATAVAENPVCGDVIRLTVKMDDATIAKARFKAKGCVACVACASVMTEWITGKTLNEARMLTLDEISLAVGELPPASLHAAHLAIDVLQAALKQLLS